MRVATEHRADATQRETRRALTAGSEKGVSRLFREAVCLATNPLGLGASPPGAAAAAVKQGKFKMGMVICGSIGWLWSALSGK